MLRKILSTMMSIALLFSIMTVLPAASSKVITKNICAYTDSISPNNLIYGPADGSWFDSIRP